MANESTTETTVGSKSSTITESSSSGDAGDDSFDFAGLAEHDDMADVSAETTPASSPQPPEATVSPASTNSPEAAPNAPAAATPANAEPATTPAAAASPQSAPAANAQSPGLNAGNTQPATSAPEASAASPLSLEQIDFSKHREAYIPKLAEMYQLTPEQVEKVRTNPEEVLPQMAANLHYEVQLNAMQTVLQALPTFISTVLEQRAREEQANNSFYSRWPKLKEHVVANPQAEEAVRQSIRAYRAANPKASQDEIIAKAGLLAMVGLGLPIDVGAETPQAPAAVGTPASAIPAAPVQQMFHRPAGVNATGHASPRPGPGSGDEGNIFEELANAWHEGQI